jgi:microcystin-dependent protein
MTSKKLSQFPNLVQVGSPTSPGFAGMITAFAGSSVPNGWALCNGSTLDKTTYAHLFARIGTTWDTCVNPLTGAANTAPGGNLFRLPDLRGTFLRGAGDFADNTKDTILGGFQIDQIQDPAIRLFLASGSGSSIRLNAADTTTSGNTGGTANLAESAARTGTETRPQNVGVNYLIKLYDDAGAIVMSGSPFVGSEFQPAPIAITGNNALEFSKFYTCDDAADSTQTVPVATGSNKVITVENTGIGDLSVVAQSTETINGVANQVIGQFQSMKIRDYAVGKWVVMH